MKVEQLMTRTVRTCSPDDSLSCAAEIMWNHDCGCVPVVLEGDGDPQLVAMITDRDVCMAAWTQGRPLCEIPVRTAMSHTVCSVGPHEPVEVALKILATNQLHRLPVLDAAGRLVGIVALADIAREARLGHGHHNGSVGDDGIGTVVESIAAPRAAGDLMTAA
jgi:CBS domain-containing protein